MEKELNRWKKPLDVDYDEVPGSISIYFSRQSCFLMSEIVLKTSKSLATPALPTHPHQHTHTYTPTYIYMLLYMHMQLLFWQRVVGFPLCFIATLPMSRMTMSNCHAPSPPRRRFASTSTATATTR